MLMNRVALPRIAAVVIASAVIGVTGPAVASAVEPVAPAAGALAQYSGAQLDRAAANMAAEFTRLTSRLSPELQNKPLNSPEVQRVLRGDGKFGSWYGCAWAVTEAALTIGVPAAKIYRIAQEFGGIPKFFKIVFTFITKGSFPANASSEAIDLIISLSGVGGIISSCL